jgi:hypothetical protein
MQAGTLKTEAKSCGQLLGSVRWTRRGEPGEWCSAECRDGIKATTLKAESRVCRRCGVPLEGKRAVAPGGAPPYVSCDKCILPEEQLLCGRVSPTSLSVDRLYESSSPRKSM